MITWQKHWRFAHWHSRKGYENAWGWPEELFLKHHKISWKNKQKSLSALTALCLHQGRHQILWLHTLSPFHSSVQSLSHVVQLCDLMDCSTPGLPVHHQLPEFTQTHVHWVSDAIQPSHPLSSLSPPTFNLSQQQGLFKWVSSSHQVAKVLEFQLQHQSFQWTPRTDLL